MRNFVFIFVSVLAFTSSLGTPAFGQDVPGQYIIRFKSQNAARSYFRDTQYSALGKYQWLNVAAAPLALIQAPDGLEGQTLSAVRSSSHVAYVEPNRYIRVPAGVTKQDRMINAEPQLPNDNRFGELWGIYNTGQLNGVPGIDVNAVKAWAITRGDSRVKIAVIDTGIDYTHPDLAANMRKNPGEVPGNGIDDDNNGYVDDVYGYDFANNDGDPMDDNKHGSHCAGSIGAVHNNKVGVAGVMSQVSLVAVKFLTGGGFGSTANAIRSIDYATKIGVHVMSNSWGGGGYSKALEESIALAAKKGIVFVAAAGNSRQDMDSRPSYPASYQLPNVIAVAAHDSSGKQASFSNYGRTSVHVAAPGVSVLSSIPGGKYASFSGTSMATPHVSGVVGLILSREGRRAAPQMRNRLIQTSRKYDSLKNTSASGGFVDAHAALNARALH